MGHGEEFEKTAENKLYLFLIFTLPTTVKTLPKLNYCLSNFHLDYLNYNKFFTNIIFLLT